MATPRYPIAAVARLTGLTLDTIRAWERRYGAVAPGRGARGRVYSDAQVRRLRLLAALAREGHPISEVANLADARLEELLRRAAEGPTPGAVPAQPAAPIAGVLDAIGRFDHEGADRELARLAALYPARDFVYEAALPLMRAAGERWHRGELSAAQEHMLSAILHAVVAGMVRIYAAPAGARRLLFATPQGELHEFGILAAAMLAASWRLGVVYLGPNLPPADIAAAALRTGAAAVVVGATGAARASVDQALAIRRELAPEIEVWVGGPAPKAAPASTGRRGRLVWLESFEEYERGLRRLGGWQARG
jgi:DNA-binding transcriptional MerR regulator/methylmalonyl-CoA mutase cobalamin-binding subunit